MTGQRSIARPFLCALAAALLIPACIALLGGSPVFDGRLLDPDCYMRLLRVMDLHEGGDWYNALSQRTNAPYGENLHWSRPLDMLLYVGAWVGAPLAGFDGALFWWGAIIGPIFQLIAFAVLAWGLRPYIAPRYFVLAALFFVLQPTLGLAFNLGRPDHHGLILALFTWAFALLLRLGAEEDIAERRRVAGWIGIANGLGLWVSVETLLAVLLSLSALAVFWALKGRDGLSLLRRYTGALTFIIAGALIIENPPDSWLDFHVMRLSFVHLVLAGLLWGSAVLLTRFVDSSARNPQSRLVAGAGAALAILGIMAAFFPDFFRGPFSEHVPDAVIPIWLKHIGELQPLWPKGHMGWALFLLQLGPAFLVVPFAINRLKHNKSHARAAYGATFLGLLIYVPVSLLQTRWAAYAQILFILPWCMAVAEIMARKNPLRPIMLPLALMGHLLMAAPVWATRPTTERVDPPDPCAWNRMAAHLETLRPHDGQKRILWTYVHPGPEMAWRTGYDVVGAPYANARAILDTYRAFMATDFSIAAEVANRRRIDMVLLCPGNAEAWWLDREAGRTLHKQLQADEGPDWLRPLYLPDSLQAFRLFAVDGAKLKAATKTDNAPP